MSNVESNWLNISVKSQEYLLINCTKINTDMKLGLAIEPSQVRLKTNADDPYTWDRMSEMEHLFTKNLSDLSTGLLQKVCDGIDKSIIAILKPISSGFREVSTSISTQEMV